MKVPLLQQAMRLNTVPRLGGICLQRLRLLVNRGLISESKRRGKSD